MDDNTKMIVNNFIDFLTKELRTHKDFKIVQVKNWSLKDFRVTVEVFINNHIERIFFDLREIKDNKERFNHLLDNAFAQLSQKMNYVEPK